MRIHQPNKSRSSSLPGMTYTPLFKMKWQFNCRFREKMKLSVELLISNVLQSLHVLI